MIHSKLAILSTHPVQYNVPFFTHLSKNSPYPIKVFYTWEKGSEKTDVGFGKEIEWDIPLLEGYDYAFISNEESPRRDFFGVVNQTLETEIKSWGATHLLVYGWNYYSHLRCLFKLKGKLKIIFRGDSTLLDESPGFKKILRRLFLKIVYRNVDFVLYVGTQNKKYFEVHGLKENQLVYGPHAIDNERFESTVCNKELLHSKLGIPVNEKILLFAGKFIEKKNPLLLLRTFCEENPVGWHLLMVGNGEKENELNSFAEGILNVHFMEFQNQKVLPCIYKAASAFILPSEGPEETWGLCINEAMACGLPVLVSRNCGCAIDLVDENENGFSFPPNEIRNGIRALFSLNDYDLKIMGEKSKVKIKEFNYQITINNLNKIINNS